MKKNNSKNIALCGLMAAVAIVIMCLGGLIPVATYVCPVLCTLIGNMIQKICGRKLAWAWYGAVCLLSLLFAPDREAAIVFCLLGSYPYIKPYFDKFKIRIAVKILYFNFIAVVIYRLMLWMFGQTQILQELNVFGTLGVLAILILANITFFMLDVLLGREFKIKWS